MATRDAIDWFVGVNYFYSEIEANEVNLQTFGLGAVGDTNGSSAETNSAALFGDAIFHLTEQTNLNSWPALLLR